MKFSRLLGLLLLTFGFYTAWTTFGIDRYPRVWVDEGWVSEAAWTHAATGTLGSPAHGSLHRYDQRVYWMPPLYFLGLSTLYQGGGDPWQAGRMLSVGLGGAGLACLLGLAWVLLRNPGGDPSQPNPFPGAVWPWLLWLALAFTADPVLWKVHRTIRFESLTGLWILASTAAAVGLRGPGGAAAAGAAAGLAAITHPTGLLALPAVLGLLGLDRRPAPKRRLAAALVAFVLWALPVLPFLAYLAGDRPFEFANVLGQNAPHLHGRAESLAGTWLSEWTRYRDYFAWPVLAPALGFWALAGLLAIRMRAPRRLGWVLLVLLGGLAWVPNKTSLYLTLAAPFVYLLAAWTASRMRRQALAGVAAGLWLLMLLGADAALLVRDGDCRYRTWMDPVAAAVPAGARVAGTYVTWFPFREHPYLEFHRRRAGDVADGRPEYVLWGGKHLEDPIFARLRSELGPFLAAHAETLARSSSSCYGEIVLYHPRWNELDPEAGAGWERYGQGEVTR